jgi:TetR/AcrR family transcriptional repressor of nem operon
VETARTTERILDIAERLVQTRGFNGFSYADVAAELGVTKASLHYHFASKAALGEALITRYSERFFAALDRIDHTAGPAAAKLHAYAELYADVARGRRMCLCGMLAAEYQTLPDPVRGDVITFFDGNETWLAAVLEQGRSDDSLGFEGSARDMARVIISGLEGAMLVAGSYRDPERFATTTRALLSSLTTPDRRTARAGPV